jgi:glutamate-1-semialdehyde aminotransferase
VVEAAFAAHPEQIACIILEPVVGNAAYDRAAAGLPRRTAQDLTRKSTARC